MMNYRGYLKTDAWKSFRDRTIVERSCCEHCGSTVGLQLHHLSYEHLGDEAPEDVLVLCSDCHREIEGRFDEDDLKEMEGDFDEQFY